jgi:hypothetical protein
MENSKLLRCKLRLHVVHAGDVAARPIEAGHEARLNWVQASAEDYRYCCGGSLGGERGLRAAGGGNYINAPTNKIRGKFRQPIECIVRPAILDGNILAFDVAGLTQTFVEGS